LVSFLSLFGLLVGITHWWPKTIKHCRHLLEVVGRVHWSLWQFLPCFSPSLRAIEGEVGRESDGKSFGGIPFMEEMGDWMALWHTCQDCAEGW
jgi:hypothetical protein